jgi:hypothetical protein
VSDWPRIQAVTELALALLKADGGPDSVPQIRPEHYAKAQQAFDAALAELAMAKAYYRLGLLQPYPEPRPFIGMKLCEICGNKRCPHANDPANACTGSNEKGQPGSAYP